MSHPLNEIVARPLQEIAGDLAEILTAGDIAETLGDDATHLLGGRSRLAVLRLALTTDTLRVLVGIPCLDLGDTPRLRFVAPFLVGAARILAATLPGNESLAELKRDGAGDFLAEYAQDLAPFGGANEDTAWLGVRLARIAAQLTRMDVLAAHRDMLLRLADAALEQPAPLIKPIDDVKARRHLVTHLARVAAEPEAAPPTEATLAGPTRINTGKLGPGSCCAFSHDSSQLAVGTQGGGVFVLDWEDGRVHAGTKIASRLLITGLAYVPGAARVLFAGEDDRLRLLDVEANLVWWTRGTSAEIHQIVPLPEPGMVLLGVDERALVLRVTDEGPGGRAERRIPAFSARRIDSRARFAVDPTGRLLAAIESASSVEGHEDIRLIDAATARRVGTLVGHSDVVSAIAFSPWGRLLASCGYDGTVRLWDTRHGVELLVREMAPHARLTALAFTPDGQRLLVASGEHTDEMFKDEQPSPRKGVFVLDVATGEVIQRFSTRHEVEFLTLSPDGRFAALIGHNDPAVLVWELKGPEDLCTADVLRPHVGDLYPPADDNDLEAQEDEPEKLPDGASPFANETDEVEEEVEDDPLHEAARSGNLTALEEALALGDGVDRRRDDRTALHVAAELGHAEIVRLLLEAGADSFQRDFDGHTARWLALANGQRATADLFKARGEVWEDERQLLEAIREDDSTAKVRTLLEAGADPDGREHATSLPPDLEDLPADGATPLTQTAFLGDEELLGLLLEAGADVTRCDEVPLSAWGAAITGGQAEAAALLVLHGALPDPGSGLRAAIQHGNAEALERFLEAGADVNEATEDEEGNRVTPLGMAISEKRNHFALRLLAAGARVEKTAEAGYSFLHQALSNPDRDRLVRELLQRGLDPDERDDNGRPPLLRVARAPEEPDAFDLAAILLQAGAAVNIRDEQGRTALHLLARHETGGVDLAELLVAFGADVTLLDGKERTALRGARKKQNLELVTLLEDHARLADLPRRLTQPRGPDEKAWRGRVRLAGGKWAEAVADFEAAIKLAPDRADPAHSDWFARRAEAHDELGNSRPGQALRHYSQAHGSPLMTARLAHYRIADLLDPDFWCAANNLAWCAATWPVESMRDGPLAVRYALDVESRLPGPCWSPIDTLAAAYAAAGRFAEAVTAMERALELAPEQERSTLRVNLARYRQGRGWRDPADETERRPPAPEPWLTEIDQLLRAGSYRLALAQAEAAVSAGSPTLDMQIDLGRALMAWDRAGDALPHIERAAGQLERGGEITLRRIRVLLDLSAARIVNQQIPAAATAIDQALTLAAEALDEKHPLRGELLIQRGNLSIYANDYEGADEQLREALAFCADHLEPPHLTTARCLASLAHMAQIHHRYDEALNLLVDVIEILEQVLGPRHPRVAFTLAVTVEALLALDEPARAIPYARHALELLEAALGDEHRLTQSRREALDRCLDAVNPPE